MIQICKRIFVIIIVLFVLLSPIVIFGVMKSAELKGLPVMEYVDGYYYYRDRIYSTNTADIKDSDVHFFGSATPVMDETDARFKQICVNKTKFFPIFTAETVQCVENDPNEYVFRSENSYYLYDVDMSPPSIQSVFPEEIRVRADGLDMQIGNADAMQEIVRRVRNHMDVDEYVKSAYGGMIGGSYRIYAWFDDFPLWIEIYAGYLDAFMIEQQSLFPHTLPVCAGDADVSRILTASGNTAHPRRCIRRFARA